MAEQAVSALNAVKASQTEKAKALLENARLQNRATDKPSLHEPAPAAAAAPIHPPAPSVPEAPAGGGSSDMAADKAETVIPKHVPATPTPASGQPIAGQTAAADSNQPQAARGSIAEEPAGQDATRRRDVAHDAVPQPPGNPGRIPTAPAPMIANRTAAGERRSPWSRPGLIAAVLAVAGLLGYQYLPDSADNGADSALSPEAPVTAQPSFGEPETRRATITVKTGETGSAGESGSKDSLTWRPAMPPGKADQEAATSREATPATDTLATPDAPAVDEPRPDSNGPDGVASLTPDSATPATEPAVVEPAAGDTPQTGQRTAPRPPPRSPGYGYYPQRPAWPQPYNRPAYSGYPGK